MKPLLKTLAEAPGPSGYEDAVRKIVLKEVRSLADEVRVDALGNVVARKKPARTAQNPQKVMIFAHMDEIGVIVSHVDQKGFVRFASIGGIIGRYTLGARVRFLNGARGLVGYDRLEHPDKAVPISDMYIDVGARSREECPVKIGEVGVFERAFLEMGDRLVAKALDDRAGVTVLIETLRNLRIPSNDVYFVFTTQEEVGKRGVGPAAFGIEPEIGIAVDVTPAGDTPASTKMVLELGKGPCVMIHDSGMLADPRIVEWMIKTADRLKTPYQRGVLPVGTSEASGIQINRAGVMTGGLSIPVRYIHSSSEMADYSDMKNSVKLLTALAARPIPENLLSIMKSRSG